VVVTVTDTWGGQSNDRVTEAFRDLVNGEKVPGGGFITPTRQQDQISAARRG
jgi:hypothetical protein